MKWISVKDRLPELGKDVIIMCKDYHRPHITISSVIKDGNRTNSTIYGHEGLRWSYFLGCRRLRVSYWMPLPEPPKQ